MVGALLVTILLADRIVYLLSPKTIERHLLRKTPLGSSEADVLRFLRQQGVSADVATGHIPPSPPSDYPLTKIGGEAFIHESIAHYRLVFRTDVEVFYIFDASGKLVDLRVRKTVDAL